MDLRHLRYFIAVADELSFTRAAIRLHTAQPSLSQQIRDLEEQIGTPLLIRTKRKVELTKAGLVFLEEARLTLAQADRAIARARQAGEQRSSMLTIGFVPAAEVKIFPMILPTLRMRLPHLKVELRSLPTLEQEEALLRGEIDIAFMREPLISKEFEKTIVLTEPLLVALPINHPLAALERIPVHMLSGEPFISTNPRFSGYLYDLVEEYCTRHNLVRNSVQIASNILLNLNLVGMGLGYSLLPAYVEKLVNKSVCCRPIDSEPPMINLLMASRINNQSEGVLAMRELIPRTSPQSHN